MTDSAISPVDEPCGSRAWVNGRSPTAAPPRIVLAWCLLSAFLCYSFYLNALSLGSLLSCNDQLTTMPNLRSPY